MRCCAPQGPRATPPGRAVQGWDTAWGGARQPWGGAAGGSGASVRESKRRCTGRGPHPRDALATSPTSGRGEMVPSRWRSPGAGESYGARFAGRPSPGPSPLVPRGEGRRNAPYAVEARRGAQRRGAGLWPFQPAASAALVTEPAIPTNPIPHALTHSRTHALTHSRTHALSHFRTFALSHSRTNAPSPTVPRPAAAPAAAGPAGTR
jgi:hypothetical protein